MITHGFIIALKFTVTEGTVGKLSRETVIETGFEVPARRSSVVDRVSVKTVVKGSAGTVKVKKDPPPFKV